MIAWMFPDWLHRAQKLSILEMPGQMLSVERDFADPNPALPKGSQLSYNSMSYLRGICCQIVEVHDEDGRLVSRLKRSLPNYFVKQRLSIGNRRVCRARRPLVDEDQGANIVERSAELHDRTPNDTGFRDITRDRNSTFSIVDKSKLRP